LHPVKINALYFVANGQGRHVFVGLLGVCGWVVRAYQLKKH
jgi:UPF0755 protein